MMRKSATEGGCGAARSLMAIIILAAAAWACFLSAGCGLETEEANKKLSAALQHQQAAEAVLERFATLPAEWETIFSVPVGPDQVNQARQLLQAREQDLQALDKELKAWGEELNAILSLNVEEKVKEYVRLKLNAIKCWADYAESCLLPVVKGYQGVVEEIAYGRPKSEVDKRMAEIKQLVTASGNELTECESSTKIADDYFKENELGQTE
jgi:hypothetical protein